ncbi:MAG: histidine phosphatase family protein [Pseudomonadota bacterium]
MLADGVRLIHVRHGETDWNAEGRLQGQLDIQMNSHGREQATHNGRKMAARLRDEGVDPATLRFVSSPLGRSSQTMSLIRAELGLDGEFARDDRLMELTFGEWSGHTYEELKQSGSRDLVKARKRDKWGFRPPGGETYGELAIRIAAWLESVTSDTVVTSHGGVLRVLFGHLCGTPWHQVPGLPAPQDRFAIFSGGSVEFV